MSQQTIMRDLLELERIEILLIKVPGSYTGTVWLMSRLIKIDEEMAAYKLKSFIYADSE